MAAFVIHYDLYRGDREDYQDLYDALEKAGAVRATESTWFIATSWEAVKLREWVQRHLHEEDMIAVNVLSAGDGFGSANLPPAAVAWMNEHLKARKAG